MSNTTMNTGTTTAVSTSDDGHDEVLIKALAESPMAHNGDFTPNDEIRLALQAVWKERGRTPPSSSSSSPHPKWLDRLWDLQSNDPKRHYHTVVHLYEMLEYWKMVQVEHSSLSSQPHRWTPQEQEAIELAIFFHDAIYDATAKSSKNEDDSIALFQEFVQDSTEDDDDDDEESIDPTVVELVVRFIDATKQHVVAEDKFSPALALFLDLDMAVLGKSKHCYNCYAQLIRKEYQHVPHDTYCTARADVLEQFLQQPHIYGTPLFRRALEERARQNLRDEIESLRKGIIPGEGGGK